MKTLIFEDKAGDLPNVFIQSCKEKMDGCEFGQSWKAPFNTDSDFPQARTSVVLEFQETVFNKDCKLILCLAVALHCWQRVSFKSEGN